MYEHDPYGQYRQAYYAPQGQASPVPRYSASVERTRGLGGLANSTHLLLTVLTCGLWLFVWVPWWIIRMVIPRKRITRTYYR